MSYLDYLKNTGTVILTVLVMALPYASGLYIVFGGLAYLLSWDLDDVVIPWLGWSIIATAGSLLFTIPLHMWWDRERIYQKLLR